MFDYTEPTNASEGTVFIKLSLYALGTCFNALQHSSNCISIHPLLAKQYISGEWITKNAMIYQSNTWSEWGTYLYKEGDSCIDITGGWTTQALALTSSTSAAAPTLTKYSDYMNIVGSTTRYSGGIARTILKIDLSNYSTVTVYGNFRNMYSSSYLYIRAFTAIGSLSTQYSAAQQLITTSGTQYVTMDVSNINESCYIAFCLYTQESGQIFNFDIYNIFLS